MFYRSNSKTIIAEGKALMKTRLSILILSLLLVAPCDNIWAEANSGERQENLELTFHEFAESISVRSSSTPSAFSSARIISPFHSAAAHTFVSVVTQKTKRVILLRRLLI